VIGKDRNRRADASSDRRRRRRGGRRAADPRTNWRRLGWLFAAYAMYLSLRSLPTTIVRRLKRTPTL
jgi:hypothetical protein